MPKLKTRRLRFITLGDLLRDLGDIVPDRVRADPPPGRATKKDVEAILDHENRLYELVEGVLVEKAMGARESYLAALIIHYLYRFLGRHDLGIVLGADGTVEINLGLVRIPDVCFIARDRLPGGELPEEPIPEIIPNLAVEVISVGNTPAEMQRKLGEYFHAGVELVWYVYPKTQTIVVYTAIDKSVTLSGNQVLTGGDVLPGFRLPLKKLFAKK